MNKIFTEDFVRLDRIPIIESSTDDPEYDLDIHKISLESKEILREFVINSFCLLDLVPCVEINFTLSHDLLELKKILPADLRDSFLIFENHTFGSKNKISYVAFNPENIKKLLIFLKNFNSLKNIYNVEDLIALLKKKQRSVDFYINQNLVINKKIISLSSKVFSRISIMIDDENSRIFKIDSFVHEVSHYATLSNKFGGLLGEMLILINTSEVYCTDEKLRKRLDNKRVLLYVLLEFEAFINEFFNSLIIDNFAKYEQDILLARISSLLSNFTCFDTDNEGELNEFLHNGKVRNIKIPSVHNIATLLIVLYDIIDVDKFLLNLNFSKATKRSSNIDLRELILERVDKYLQNPDDTFKYLIEAYDFVQKLLLRVVQEATKDVDEYIFHYQKGIYHYEPLNNLIAKYQKNFPAQHLDYIFQKYQEHMNDYNASNNRSNYKNILSSIKKAFTSFL